MEREDKAFALFGAMVVLALLIMGAINLYAARGTGSDISRIAYSQFLDAVDQDRVTTVEIEGDKLGGIMREGGKSVRFRTITPQDPGLVSRLHAHHVKITADAAPPTVPSVPSLLGLVLPVVFIVGLLVAITVYAWRRIPGASASNTLAKSRARKLAERKSGVTFADVAGVDEARESLQEIVDFLKDPSKFQALGGRIPRGVLLVGPPGTGKTLLARAIAGEADVPFFTISGSDFVEMFVGVGASRVRAMFDQAKKAAPCIIFMDEIDAVGRKRGAGLGAGSDEREQTLNQLLVEMDGFESDQSVILIAATNRPDILDPALLRPGRFDREIVVNNPDVLGREQILAVHVRKTPLAADVDLKVLAQRTSGFSGADLMNLVNEAALLAVRRERTDIGMREFEDARDTVTMGAERRTHVMTEDERRLTAYREGGRAIVALHAPAADPVHKVTIVTRGRTGGQVKQSPEEDRRFQTLQQVTSQLAILMAGRAAEELRFGRDQITSGAAGDIDEATKLARTMVTRWGLSEALGAVAYGENQDEVFLGASVSRQQNISEETARAIDAEVRRLLDAALDQARAILIRQRADLDLLAQALLREETLTGEEIRSLLAARAKPRRA